MTRIAAILCTWLLAGGTAAAQCQFQGGEYVNPFSSGCADRVLEYTENRTSDTQVALGYPVPVPVESVDAGDYFRSYDSLFAGQQAMMLEHGNVHGEVVGSTHGGADIWAYRIGTPGSADIFGQPKGAVMAIAGVHAREWQPPEALAEIFERAVATGDDGGIGQYLTDNLVVVLVPMVNVDGFRQTQRHAANSTADQRQPRDGRMRRKNMHRADNGGLVDDDLTTALDNFFGVDLNRNHPFGFQSDSRNQDVHSLIYAGAAPHSEVETQAVLNAADLAPGERLRLFMDIHSFTQIYFAANTSNQRLNSLTETLAQRMRGVTGFKYRYQPTGQIGTHADFFGNNFEIPAWTLETEPLDGGQDYGGTGVSHSGFVTPDSEIARLRDEIADTSLLGFYHQAGPPAVIAADIRDADGDLVWSADWQSTAAGTRTLSLGADGALEGGTSYTLWLAFDKPMRWRTDGEIAQFRGQDVNPLHPVITLEIDRGSSNEVIELPAADGQWLDAPGPGPDGFLNYRDDAFAFGFTLPGDLPEDATQAVLVIEAEDMAGLGLDADPATAADWRNGGWLGYEDVAGAESNTGGADCTLPLWIGNGTRGEHALRCNAWHDAQQPEPEPEPEPEPPQRRGGGGSADWLLLLALLAFSGAVLRSAPTRRRARTRGTNGPGS